MADADPVYPDFRPTQEIRFAVVMYGGVSLAIYINGVAQELLNLVIATAPEVSGDVGSKALYSDQDLKSRSTAVVYRKVGQLLRRSKDDDEGDGQPKTDDDWKAGDSIKTRFLVDIISGTSAGGINGLYLAKALANEQKIDGLKRLWVDEGDIALLINDSGSYDGIDLRRTKPASALNSRRMYWKLLEAFDAMDASRDAVKSSRLVDELDLWITTTDLQGVTLPIDLYDRFVFEKRHRKAFRFVYRNTSADEDVRNDFQRASNPFLAFAARCTSAFPFAFEPMRLIDIDEVVKNDRFRRLYGDRGSSHSDWKRFFDEYRKPGLSEGEPEQSDEPSYKTQAFADGGYLDNKPFTWATQTLDRRRANHPVSRRLIYIEPDPGAPHLALRRAAGIASEREAWQAYGPLAHIDPAKKERPNALENVYAAATGIPRYETIREDLDALVSRNREVDRIEMISGVLDDAVEGGWSLPRALSRRKWRAISVRDLVSERGLQYLAYHRLRMATVGDGLAQLVTRLAGFDERSDEYAAIRCFIQAWTDRHYPETGTGEESQHELFLRFDLAYRLRRLDFLQERVDDELAKPGADEAGLQALKRSFTVALDLLRAKGRELRSRDPKVANPVRDAVAALPIARTDLYEILDGARSKRESVENARERLDRRDNRDSPTLDAAITDVADTLEGELDGVFSPARNLTRAAILNLASDSSVRRSLMRDFRHYDLYDSVRFPITYGHVGEADRVEVIRISPHDATAIIDETAASEPRRKLAGIAVHHFGGFLDRAWRRNDILWGRLDGSERLIKTLISDTDLANKLVEEAHLAILEEEFGLHGQGEFVQTFVQTLLEVAPKQPAPWLSKHAADADRSAVRDYLEAVDPATLAEVLDGVRTPRRILDFMKASYEVNRDLDPRAMLSTAGRFTSVTGKVLDEIGDAPGVKRPLRWGVRAGVFAWGLAEVAAPRSLRQLLTRYWLQLILLVAVLMIVGGAVFGAPATAKAGWVLLLIVVVLKAAIWIVEDLTLRPLRRLRQARRYVELRAPMVAAAIRAPFHVIGAMIRLPDAVAVLDALLKRAAGRIAGRGGMAWFAAPLVVLPYLLVAPFVLITTQTVATATTRSRRSVGGVAVFVAVALVVVTVGLAVLEVTRHVETDVERATCSMPNRVTEVIQDLWPWDDDACAPS